MQAPTPFWFLILDDDPLVTRALERIVARVFDEIVVAHTTSEARARLSEPGLVAATIDIDLPDESGLRIASEIREHHPSAALLALSGILEPDPINQALRLGIPFAAKPCDTALLTGFVERAAMSNALCLSTRVRASFERRGWSVTATQVLLLSQAVVMPAGTTQPEIAEKLGIGRNTVKSHVSALLATTGATSFDALVRSLRAELAQRHHAADAGGGPAGGP